MALHSRNVPVSFVARTTMSDAPGPLEVPPNAAPPEEVPNEVENDGGQDAERDVASLAHPRALRQRYVAKKGGSSKKCGSKWSLNGRGALQIVLGPQSVPSTAPRVRHGPRHGCAMGAAPGIVP